MTLPDFRAEFPHAAAITYLDHAATGPLSRTVMSAVEAFLVQRHESQPNNYVAIMPRLLRGRERLARLMGTIVDRVEYAPNTSYALNVLAMGYPWSPGDRVAVPACEFPANVQPWFGARERHGVSVDFIPQDRGTFTLEAVEQTLRPETRILSVSWVQFLSGFRCDLPALSALCRDRGIVLAVDAIQGLGGLRMNVDAAGVDFLAAGGQKWMLGMQGSAFFYVSRSLQDRLIPIRGWLNGPVDWEDFGAFSEELHPDAVRFRVGTLNSIGCLALDAAAGLFLKTGPDAIEERILSLRSQLAGGLDQLGLRRYGSSDPVHASGIVAVDVPDPDGLHAHLMARNIHASVRDRKLRLAPHGYNTEDEIQRTLEAVAEGLVARVTG